MTSPIDEHFFARLRVQNDTFAASLPAVLARLAALLSEYEVHGADPAGGAELRELLHMLAGSAVTFGYRRLGHDARFMEQRLRVLQAFPTVAPADWAGWYAELAELVRWARIDPKADYTSTDCVQ